MAHVGLRPIGAPLETFLDLLRRHMGGLPRGPFNLDARYEAGFTTEEMAALTADLRAGGIIRRRRTRAQMAEAERTSQEDWDERHSRIRRSRRLQGEDPEEEFRCHVSSGDTAGLPWSVLAVS